MSCLPIIKDDGGIMDTAMLIPQEENELRARNMAIVKKYIEYAGRERINRKEVYAEDVRGGLYTWDSGEIKQPLEGIQQRSQFDEKNTEYYPDWSHNDIVIYQTIDPNVYVATCKGFGNYMNPIYGFPFYENFFFNTFIIENGRIKEYFEHMNACDMTRQFGLESPTLKRPKREYGIGLQKHRFPPKNTIGSANNNREIAAGHDTVIPDSTNKLRLRNMKTIQKFMELKGDEYLSAYELFQDQAWTGIHTTDTGVPEGVGGGIENIKAWFAYNVKYFPEWKNSDITIFQKDDPNKFIIKCWGEGYINLPDYEKTYYKAIFFHDFEMRAGKIQVHWVYFNISHLLRTMGKNPPSLQYPPSK
jgi:phenazine biosynthesis protein